MLSDVIGLSEQQFIGFLLAFLRIAAVLSIAPVLGSSSVPVRVRVFLALLLTVAVLPLLRTGHQLERLSLLQMWPLAMKEVAIGLFLGFNAKFIFESFQFAGRLISTQMGLGVANLIDPDNGQPVTPIGNIYSMMAIVFFLTLNGHHMIIAALYKSFEVVPVYSLSLIKDAAKSKMLMMFNQLFVTGIKLAAPTMATLFLIETCMALMARIVPRMNIFFIGLPVRLGVGLLIIIASLPIFYTFFTTTLAGWQQDMSGIVNYF